VTAPARRAGGPGTATLASPAPPVRRLARVVRLAADAPAAAEAASLRYVSDTAPGIRRLRVGRGRFRYVAPDGSPVRDFGTRRRIRALAIPPAWTDVWICPLPEGHIQAVGRDRRGRKQYRYHARWRAIRDATKYARMALFAARLPAIRRQVARDLAAPGLSRDKVLATVVRLLETSLIRVGNTEYAEHNKSFGLTTLRSRHVRVDGATLRFEFRGKGGKRHVVDVADRRLARVVARCQELPGHELFQYVAADGGRHSIGSADVNAYVRRISGEEFTAKDFRTWAGTVLAARALRDEGAAPGAKRRVARAIEAVAGRLGNTAAVCRKCYVHPGVIQAYLGGTLERLAARAGRRPPGLTADEAAILPLLDAGMTGRLAGAAPGPAPSRRVARVRRARRGAPAAPGAGRAART
jgi:DNA topoisomerase-1